MTKRNAVIYLNPIGDYPKLEYRQMASIHVLLAQYRPGEAELLREMLASSPDPRFRLTLVTTFTAALSRAVRGECDVILLDLSLPDFPGVGAVQRLALAAPRMPIVVLSAEDQEDAAIQALRHGAQDCVAKGHADPAAMIRTVRRSIERKYFERVLAERAHLDPLTGLVSRALFLDRLSHALARANRTRKRVALLFIDADGFGTINDTHGPDAGDGVLKEIANRLSVAARKGDTVARLGGDEFVLLLEDLEDVSQAGAAADRLLRSAEAPFAVTEGETMRITCSLGIAAFPDGAAGADALLRNAEEAMYCARKAGGNRVRYYRGR